jgi:hypothetical protein
VQHDSSKDGQVDKKALKTKIESLGGKVSKEVDKKTAAVVTTRDAVEKKSKSKVIKAAVEFKIQVSTWPVGELLWLRCRGDEEINKN